MPTTSPRAEGRPLVLGHRGASAIEPENTMAAFRRALGDGADGFELDVWRCGSGEIVVHHDADTARTTGVLLRVERTPWSELRRLDAGVWKGGAGRHPIPLLAEVLDAFPNAVVNVELKSSGRPDPRLALGVARVVRAAGAERRVVVSSFDLALLAAFRAAAPRVPAGVLFDDRQRWGLRAAIGALLGVASIHPQWTLAAPERVARWRAAGRAVHVWTVDDAAAVAALCRAGVDGLICNAPGAARAVVLAATGR